MNNYSCSFPFCHQKGLLSPDNGGARRGLNQKERVSTAPPQLKMKGFAYKKITRFVLQIFLLSVKIPSFSKRCSDDVDFAIQ